MDLKKYQIFLQVLEAGSLTRAAEGLGCTQSAVSHAIQTLEQELGFPLMRRSRGGVRLTEAGEAFRFPGFRKSRESSVSPRRGCGTVCLKSAQAQGLPAGHLAVEADGGKLVQKPHSETATAAIEQAA